MSSGNKKYIFAFVLLFLWAGTLVIIQSNVLGHLDLSEEEKGLLVRERIREETNSPFVFEEIPIERSWSETVFHEDTEMCGMFPCLTGQELVDLFDHFEQEQDLDFLSKYIYQIPEVDLHIKAMAEARGYKERGFARDEDIVAFENVFTRPEVRDAYILMRNELQQNEGVNLHFVSGYRSSVAQRGIFLNKMSGIDPLEIPSGMHDEHIMRILNTSAVPAYSKHHTGYALDFGCGTDALVYEFSETACYRWLAYNNFENAKRYGFIPSYPEGVEHLGPLPEPWEFVWVSVENVSR